ncbi:hypothetical protein NEOLEDRAFT_342801 [Neolentinus lepideus HHB14362 ss-1]|uniref:Uncharacterized protein n=1 Tax=Neolentinus lepideus HHB14362 ss-1 TaxID=1314782 RepID=A0A165M5U7_9AGAM|nr:hypothetical protein NEOLEDRAFT_342801 [Neolentinus lepideus HHB14362 ss-1]
MVLSSYSTGSWSSCAVNSVSPALNKSSNSSIVIWRPPNTSKKSSRWKMEASRTVLLAVPMLAMGSMAFAPCVRQILKFLHSEASHCFQKLLVEDGSIQLSVVGDADSSHGVHGVCGSLAAITVVPVEDFGDATDMARGCPEGEWNAWQPASEERTSFRLILRVGASIANVLVSRGFISERQLPGEFHHVVHELGELLGG